ncbi:MAG: AmmeMemoRadiSam system radical SAM enzyme [Tissierellia bacterium]|nr:AmmeMemoRadiSam system radical SAM enzyme [Tissierellia bacterium]
MSKIRCEICPHYCNLRNGQVGICRARTNVDGKILSINYGHITSMNLDPIEKKPLRRFHPGKNILSIGSFGCNLSCSFCQNHEIAMASKDEIRAQNIEPDNMIKMALDLAARGNIGIAYTYNEPLVGYEYVRDCSKLARDQGLKNVLVTNGCFNEEPMKELFPYIDAFNIDLKGFTDEFYKKIGGNLETVKNFIALASNYSHVEITTLIIPDENDSEEEIRELSDFIASIDSNIPLHISRFFPSYKMNYKAPTDISLVYHLADIARENLKYVYQGNC